MKSFFIFFYHHFNLFINIDLFTKWRWKRIVEAVATQYLDSAANESSVPSNLISSESLDKAKADYLSSALNYDSTGNSNAMMLLTANKIKSMTSAEVWDYMNKVHETMGKLDMNIQWNLVNIEIKNNVAFVTYKVKNKAHKVMELKKENNKWKVVLSFGSIF